MEEDYIYLTLHCADCGKGQDCSLWPHGALSLGREGCTRKITEDDRIRFYHYMNEVLPFIRTYKSKKTIVDTFNEIDDFLDYIYSQPAGHSINKSGKIKKN